MVWSGCASKCSLLKQGLAGAQNVHRSGWLQEPYCWKALQHWIQQRILSWIVFFFFSLFPLIFLVKFLYLSYNPSEFWVAPADNSLHQKPQNILCEIILSFFDGYVANIVVHSFEGILLSFHDHCKNLLSELPFFHQIIGLMRVIYDRNQCIQTMPWCESLLIKSGYIQDVISIVCQFNPDAYFLANICGIHSFIQDSRFHWWEGECNIPCLF